MAELAACVLSLCPVASGAAGPYEDGASAYKRGDYATALRLWRPLAEQGDAYEQFSLGAMYDEGQGVPQNYAVAVEWFRKAADQGLAQAQYKLGVSYAKGRGVSQDDAVAVEWYRKAAQQGHASAQFNLGVKYAKGKGVPQDYAAAHMWFNLAASRFPASEATLRDKAVKIRETIAKRMTSAQIAEAQRMAREWKPTE